MIKRTYSLNLIAYLKAYGINVQIYYENGRIFGEYDRTNETVLLSESYRSDEELHRFLNEFKELKSYKVNR